MAPVFIFAEQVRNIVRSGKKEIEIPEGARISSAAADLVKEHQIRIKTVAPGKTAEENTPEVDVQSAKPDNQADLKSHGAPLPEKGEDRLLPEECAGFSEDELEEIVNRVVERFRQIKGEQSRQTASAEDTPSPGGQDTPAADDDLVICRCEEITRGEIKEAIRNGIQSLNGIKRITRAGMGLCQGQTCQPLVARILTEELGLAAGDIDPTTARGPVRPIRLQVFANS